MKYYITFILLIITSYSLYRVMQYESSDKKTIQIKKVESGFEIYTNLELMLELTKQNCDSIEIELIEYIYNYK